MRIASWNKRLSFIGYIDNQVASFTNCNKPLPDKHCYMYIACCSLLEDSSRLSESAITASCVPRLKVFARFFSHIKQYVV